MKLKEFLSKIFNTVLLTFTIFLAVLLGKKRRKESSKIIVEMEQRRNMVRDKNSEVKKRVKEVMKERKRMDKEVIKEEFLRRFQ